MIHYTYYKDVLVVSLLNTQGKKKPALKYFGKMSEHDHPLLHHQRYLLRHNWRQYRMPKSMIFFEYFWSFHVCKKFLLKSRACIIFFDEIYIRNFYLSISWVQTRAVLYILWGRCNWRSSYYTAVEEYKGGGITKGSGINYWKITPSRLVFLNCMLLLY